MAVIPGKWEVFTLDSGTVVVRARDGDTQYNVAKVFSDGEGDVISTASLIAAAPDLLARLHAMVSGMECECDKSDPEHPLCDVCWSRLVIAKAEGRTDDQ